ncbi:hypothetical protein GFL54_19845 [Rhizobium laguerreae]|uniref:hypothetical protein n=1 Tax=Rhizobium laguerreae TaxID=1076926 RepID=UPI00143F884D|nr:hypothetical protein [Rhizobium laguerreae]NKM86509.1 hypothetical protein [Rhizobium laguerreae]
MAKPVEKEKQYPSFKQLLGDAVRKKQTRPFDTELKELLKSPGVLARLWNDWAEYHRIDFGPGRDDPDPIGVRTEIEFLGEEFRDRQVTFRTDLVSDIGKNRILHVEQQTKHNELVMLRRMATYASLISSFYKYRKNLLQIYYYTGDPIGRWSAVAEPKATVNNSNWSSANRFVFIDAGAHDAWAMLRSNHVEYAMLGLLSRDVPRLDDFVEKLLRLMENKYEPGSLESADKLVTCAMVASLRGREDIVMEKSSAKDRARLQRDHARYYNRFRPFIGEMVDARIDAEVNAHKGNLENMMQRIVQLEGVAGIHFPMQFMHWSVRHLSGEQLDALELRINDHRDIHALFDACGIPREALEPGLAATYG